MDAGHSTSAFYQLRKRDDAGSFAAAWDKAVEAGARRVADLLMEYAIYGVPETISKEGRPKTKPPNYVLNLRRKWNG